MLKALSICAALLMPAFSYAHDVDSTIGTGSLVFTDSYRAKPENDGQIELQSNEMYQLNLPVDIPVTAVGTGWSVYAFSKIYSKDASTVDQINALNKNNINGFDRWAAGKSSDKADAHSNYLFYGSIPAPFLLLFDKKIRQDAPKVGFLYLESMAITGLLYTGSTYFVDRYRPEAYDTRRTAEDRTSGNLRNAFFAGHVALVGTSTFFIAKVYGDYHPESSLKWVLYGGAAAATGATAYMRHRAGKHFPTDIVLGTAVGVLSGVLVPHLHKNKAMKNTSWNVSPTIGNGYGFAATYTFK